MNPSSFPSGHGWIVVNSAIFNVRRKISHPISLTAVIVTLLVLSFWRHHEGGLIDLIYSLLLFSALVTSVCVLLFLGSLLSVESRRKYLKYKIRRHQLLKKVYKDTPSQEKIYERIDYYEQHLRVIDEKLKAEFFLGT